MKVSIVGITGYSGLELVKILHNHKKITIVSIHATKDIGRRLSDVYPHLSGICDLLIEPFDASLIMKQADLVLFATPSGIASQLSQAFVQADFPVIDMSGDHRLPVALYKKWYKKESASADVLSHFTYGLAEFTAVKGKRFIANPGCYATATLLALIPLLKAKVIAVDSIIVDAKSGLSGAGKALSDTSHFVNVHDNYVTYKLNKHQHIPEIIQELKKYDESLEHIQFSTSLLPLNRGIVATCYVHLTKDLSRQEIDDLYQAAYQHKAFVRIEETLPNLHHVIGSNQTAIGFDYNDVTGILTVVAVIDNLIKGAAGQAVQNLNLMMGWDETLGLDTVAQYV